VTYSSRQGSIVGSGPFAFDVPAEPTCLYSDLPSLLNGKHTGSGAEEYVTFADYDDEPGAYMLFSSPSRLPGSSPFSSLSSRTMPQDGSAFGSISSLSLPPPLLSAHGSTLAPANYGSSAFADTTPEDADDPCQTHVSYQLSAPHEAFDGYPPLATRYNPDSSYTAPYPQHQDYLPAPDIDVSQSSFEPLLSTPVHFADYHTKTQPAGEYADNSLTNADGRFASPVATSSPPFAAAIAYDASMPVRYINLLDYEDPCAALDVCLGLSPPSPAWVTKKLRNQATMRTHDRRGVGCTGPPSRTPSPWDWSSEKRGEQGFW
jgi:hypothetical protein